MSPSRMIKPARHYSGQRTPRAHVTWYVGTVTQPDSLRTGRLIRVDGERALVQPTDEAAQRWMNVADLEGVPVQEGPRAAKSKPDLHPALELPAPLTHTLELLGLLDQGVEIQPSQYRVLAPILEQLRERGFIVERSAGSGVWALTAKGRAVVDG